MPISLHVKELLDNTSCVLPDPFRLKLLLCSRLIVARDRWKYRLVAAVRVLTEISLFNGLIKSYWLCFFLPSWSWYFVQNSNWWLCYESELQSLSRIQWHLAVCFIIWMMKYWTFLLVILFPHSEPDWGQKLNRLSCLHMNILREGQRKR